MRLLNLRFIDYKIYLMQYACDKYIGMILFAFAPVCMDLHGLRDKARTVRRSVGDFPLDSGPLS